MRLSPSDRVRIISEVGHRLGTADWGLIDLTLRQFKLPWTADWEGDDRQAYVMRMIEEGDDNILLSLGSHLGYEFTASRPRIEPAFWKKGYFRLFISHLAERRRLAADIQHKLLPRGISSFVAHNDIEPTKEWQDEIELALATCDGALALLHPGFHESKWTDQEIGYAMAREILIVAVRFGTDPYGFIGRFQGMNGNGKAAAPLARELFDILRRHTKTRMRMASALATLFCQSNSFADAKTNLRLLEKTDYWDSSLSVQVRSAAASNRQIREAAWQWNPPVTVAEHLEVFLARTDNP